MKNQSFTASFVNVTSLACGAVALLGSVSAPAQLKINVTYEAGVPQAAKDAFNSIKGLYESQYYNPVTVSIDVDFTAAGLASSGTAYNVISYANWRSDMRATSALYPGNTYLASAIGTLPVANPIAVGTGNVLVRTADARAIGVTAGQIISSSANGAGAFDAKLNFSGAANTWDYTGAATANRYNFMSTASHELNEALGIDSTLTDLSNNQVIPATFNPAAEDYFRYNSAGNRFLTTDPNAAVYFTYDPTLATYPDRFNQDSTAGGNTTADRNDWIWGNFTDAATPPATQEVQNAIGHQNEVDPLLSPTTSEYMVLSTIGWSVPEPSSFSLIGLGLLGFALKRSRRRQNP
jgi:hypothetical protein